MVALPESLAPLAILTTARRGAADYYAPMLDSADDVLRIGAWCALLDRNEVTYAQYPAILKLAANPGIRRRAFRHFETWWDHEFAAQVAAIHPQPEASTETALMQAELSGDSDAQIAAQRALFLLTGRGDLLASLVGLSERAGGWRRALPVSIERVLLNPHDPLAVLELLNLLHVSRQADLIDATTGLLDESALHPGHVIVFRAASSLLKGDPSGAIKLLGQLANVRMNRPDAALALRAVATQLNAEALDKLGEYRKAYAAYADLNKLDQGKPYDLAEFARTILGDAALPVPPLPADPRAEAFVMTGFPRSGTTLLENALAAHPLIETFEEIPSWSSMQLYLDLVLPDVTAETDTVPIYQKTRERYYAEMDRRRHKPGAAILIDKMPIRSAEAGFLAKLFPEKRFIFSIRHPFDVVLSCFKQQFVRNIAMEHFRTFEGAVRLYDFTMTQWFGVHGLDDPKVHYLRYDTLVEDFEPTVRSALDFLGVPWDDAVLGFAAAAENRSSRTPSYQKVRQGLSIGVQTAWRNYGFLFQSPEARPLHKWADFFGYPTA